MAEELNNPGDISLTNQQSQDFSDEDEKKTTKVRLNSRISDHSADRENQESDDDDELPYPGFVARSLRCLTQRNRFRNVCLRILTWSWFERISMAVILLNCVTLGMYQPCEDQICDTMRCQVLEKFDHFIFAFFAIEMIIKIVAMGLWGKLTYLDDSWNRLDCFIVLAGSIEYGVDSENLSLSAIRTIRVLRPLRAINRIPSMRILVMLLLDTLPMLGNVLLLCFFVFFIFGIIGVQLWAGVLRNRCFLNISENISYAHANLSPYFIPKKTKPRLYM